MGLWSSLSNLVHNVIHNPTDWSTQDKGNKGLVDLTTDALGIRKASLEDLAVLAGNYFLPGSSILTSRLVSPEAQKDLSSGVGQLAQLGTGFAGGGVGAGTTGIPASPYSLSNMFASSGGSVPGATLPDVTSPDLGAAQTSPTSFGNVGAGTALPPSDSLAQTVSQASNIPAYNPAAPAASVDYSQFAQGGSSAPTLGETVSGSANPLYNTINSGNTGLQATPGAGTSLGYGTSAPGVSAPSEGFFSGTTPSTNEPFSLSGMAGKAWDWAKANPSLAMRGASGLYDMYAKNQMAKAAMGRYNDVNAQIAGLYAPGSPEYEAMAQAIARKDAAAGRNSQYGTRATELAARINAAKTNALIQAAPQQNELLKTASANKFGGLNSLFFQYAMNQAQKGGV